MAFTRYYDKSVTAPAGTSAFLPTSVAIALEDAHLERIEIDVPDGHDRQTGIRILGNGTPIVPFSLTEYIVANDHYFTIPFDDDIGANDLSVQAFNTDVFDHTFYLRFVISNRQVAASAGIVTTQQAGTVATGADAGVAGLAVTPDDLAAAQLGTPPPVPDLTAPPPDTGGTP